jgi:hypothetical protein
LTWTSYALIRMLFVKEGRDWLFSTYDADAFARARRDSTVLVRTIPFLALAVVVEYLVYWWM